MCLRTWCFFNSMKQSSSDSPSVNNSPGGLWGAAVELSWHSQLRGCEVKQWRVPLPTSPEWWPTRNHVAGQEIPVNPSVPHTERAGEERAGKNPEWCSLSGARGWSKRIFGQWRWQGRCKGRLWHPQEGQTCSFCLQQETLPRVCMILLKRDQSQLTRVPKDLPGLPWTQQSQSQF